MKISLLSTDVLFASEINQIRVREISSVSTDFLPNIRALSDLKLWFPCIQFSHSLLKLIISSENQWPFKAANRGQSK